MLEVNLLFPLPLPDDPNKWNGWSKYKSPNYYERLCLDPEERPSNELIEGHCRELLRWWQKKLPLKNQPSNPLAQLLRPGLDESSRYLTEARVELLNPRRRQQLDDELSAQAQEQAVAEFHKYLTFALADGVLRAEEEKNLLRFGREHKLTDEQILGYIEAELRDSGATRAPVAEAPPEEDVPRAVRAPRPRRRTLAPKDEFLRMLQLTGLDSDGMSDDTRDAFVNMAENLGIDPSEAEDIIDLYLDEADAKANPADAPAPKIQVKAPTPVVAAPVPEPASRRWRNRRSIPRTNALALLPSPTRSAAKCSLFHPENS